LLALVYKAQLEFVSLVEAEEQVMVHHLTLTLKVIEGGMKQL
jgi:hypothetical protein